MPVINRGDDYFAVVTYTGNGTSQTISGLRFQPDFVWIKGRSGATDHALYDAQRGVQKRLESNITDAEVSSDNGVTAFNSDGFSIGSLAQVNTNGATYVAWCWKEGATQGFDIVLDTGTGVAKTVAHSLGVAPSFIIRKNRTSALGHWYVYHASQGATKTGILQVTNAFATSSNWNNTAPTSSVFSVGSAVDENASGGSFLTYLFAEVAGFSRFGSYTGNGSADGPFVFCGFRPRWIMFKCSNSTESGNADWAIIDTSRSPYNFALQRVWANQSAAESNNSAYPIDILSNGFKLRNGDANFGHNTNGNTYIFAAFAEHPFKNSLAR